MKNTTMVRNRMGRRLPGFARGAWLALACALPWLCASAFAQEETAPAAPQEEAAAATENQWTPMDEEVLASLAAAPAPEERAALLASGDAGKLQAALDAANLRIEQLADAVPAIHRDIREFRRKALHESDKAKEIRAQIQRLEDELAAYADDLPEIRERREALDAVRANMMAELRFRRELDNKLGRDGSRADSAEQPVLEP